MELITDPRLREIVSYIAPMMEADPYPDVKIAPDDPTEREAWFNDIARRREQQHAVVRQMIGSSSAAPELPSGVEAIDVRIPVRGSCGSSGCEACSRGAISAYVYRPIGATGAPAYLTLHGGGWWLMGGDILRNSGPSHATMALDLGIVVVDVDYRLTPEHKFPLPVEDCYTALAWVAEHGNELGVDPARIAMGGASAGGNLTAAVALMTRDRGGPALRGQAVQIPCLDSSCNTVSHRLYATGYGTALDRWQKMWATYLRDPMDMYNPYASPVHAASFADLPPALITVGDYDSLRDDGLIYAERLSEAGVSVTIRRFPQIHGGGLPENGPQLEKLTRDFLRANLLN